MVLGVALLVFTQVNAGSSAAPAPPAARVPYVAPQASTDARIAALQAQLRTGGPGEAKGWSALGSAYLQKVRETGDAGLYPRAEAAFARSGDLSAVVGRGTLALARHDFRGALELGERARAMAPAAASPLPVVVDALVELGRYDEAGRALQQLVDLKPGLPAYARISYFRELRGDFPGALEAMELAVDAGSSAPEGLAYVKSLEGTLEFNQGHLARAEAAYRSAVQAQPSSAPGAAGLARVAAARGRLGDSVARWRRLVDRLPLPEYVVALGETELAAGRSEQGRDDLEIVRAERQLLAANGVNTDVELALFEADHGTPADGVAVGRKAWADAPSVRSADALGWALTRAGDPRQGLTWARRALRFGWREPLALYHAGMSARAAGDRALARRYLRRLVAQAPRFSPLYGPRAARALKELE